MKAYLDAIRHLSNHEAAAVDGAPLTHERIRQLREGEWTRLNAVTARNIRGYLERLGTADPARDRPLTEVDEKRIAAKWMARLARQLLEEATEPVVTASDEIADALDDQGVADGDAVAPRQSRPA